LDGKTVDEYKLEAELRPKLKSRIGRPHAIEGYVAMSRDQILDECRELYKREGITAFSFKGLKRNKLYFPLYNKGLKLADVIKELGLEDEYQRHRESQPIRPGGRESFRWTWNRVLTTAREVAESQGSLPSAAWFQANGHGSLVASVYNLNHTWADLRSALQDFSNSNFVESRNGLRWLSHAEASLSNFLYARGIEHRKGGRYPDSYAEHSGRRYGIYDLMFMDSDSRWIDVEVWGDRPLGLEKEYSAKRAAKESFNRDNNQNFLGIGYRDCYDEDALTAILQPYIGTVEPFRFDRPSDPLIHTTHWSNADELLEHARQIAATMPDGRFPTEEWLRKRGKWANRPGNPYNTLSVYIKLWLGGIRNLRSLLDQEHFSTTEWTREKSIEAYKEFFERYEMTPDQARQQYIRKGDVRKGMYLEAAKIAAAVGKYADGAKAVRESLGIDLVRKVKWNRETILAETEKITAQYGLSPSQVLNDHRIGRLQLPENTRQHIAQTIDAANRTCGGMSALLKEIGFKSPSRPRTRR
jgi:hypothetical protein